MFDWKGLWRKRSSLRCNVYPGICLEGLMRTTRNSITVASRLVEIWNLDLSNMKQESWTL